MLLLSAPWQVAIKGYYIIHTCHLFNTLPTTELLNNYCTSVKMAAVRARILFFEEQNLRSLRLIKYTRLSCRVYIPF